MFKIIIIILTTLLISKNIYANDINNIGTYFVAKKQLEENKFEKSIYNFKNLIKKNKQYNKYAQKSKLYIIIIQYKLRKYFTCINNSKIYIGVRFKNKYFNYAKYINSKAEKKINSNVFMKIFPIKLYKRNQKFNYNLYYALKEIQLNNKIDYLNKKIEQKLINIKNNLIKHELYIINYYFNKKAFVATINRIEKTIKNYDNIHYKYNNLYILIKSYNELYLNNISKDIINKNFYNK